MFKYKQTTGELSQLVDGAWVSLGHGYSGNGVGLNTHSDEAVPNVGPCPSALWAISYPYDHPSKGPLCFRLTPLTYRGTRNAFMIHGDNAQLNHTASDGCIILAHDLRQKLADTKAQYLLVEA